MRRGPGFRVRVNAVKQQGQQLSQGLRASFCQYVFGIERGRVVA